MTTTLLDSLISEFKTEAQATSYDRWFCAKVQAAVDDPRPSVPHDEAMSRIRATIQTAERKPKAVQCSLFAGARCRLHRQRLSFRRT